MALPRMNTTLVPFPRDHPDNANLPTVNQPATILGVTITFLLLAATAMSLRLWVRLRDNLWGWDDAFVFLAGISSIIGDCLVCLMPDDGLGLHLWTLDGPHLISYFKHVYSTNIAYCISATFIKLSILCQYLRLFAETMPTGEVRQYYMARRVTISLMVICGLWGLAFTILSVFSCSPVRKNWTQNIPGRCIGWGSKVPSEFFTMFVGHSASNMTLDILVLLTPVPFLGLLRLAGKSRAGLITLFIMGCIVASVAVGRVVSFCINRAGTIPVLDMPYHTPIIYIFSVLELNLAIITASIPIFWPVIAKLASNKIWVVNEIEIHVEETQRDSFSSSPRGGSTIGLKDQSAWKTDKVDDYGGKPSAGVSVVAKTYERSTSRQAGRDTAHRHKTSTASSHHRPLDLDLGTRASQESHRALYRAPSTASLTRSEREDWMAQIDKVGSSAGRTTTKIETAELPLAHIRATER